MSITPTKTNFEASETDADSELPEGWAQASMGDIADIVGGGTPKSSDPTNFSPKGHAWLTPADLSNYNEIYIAHGARALSEKGLRYCSAVVMPAGTVLMSSRAPIGYVAIAANPISTNQGFKSFVCADGIVPEYVYFWLKHQHDDLQEMGSGTTFLEISGSRAKEIPILLAPLAEQRRITSLLSLVLKSTSVPLTHLKRARVILKNFRQAVLAAACAGRLTEDWRISRGDTRENPSELPSGWNNVELNNIADTIDPNPSHRYPSYQDGTVPIFATEQMKGLNDWDATNAKLVNSSFHAERESAHGFRKDDIIFARKGRLGFARRPPSVDKYVFSHTMFIIRTHRGTLSEYLLWYLRQDTCVAWLLNEMNPNTGVPTLGKSYMERLPIQLPGLEEQQEIARRVDALFRLADAIETKVTTATVRAEKLTQTILAKAFRGELVPTDAELARREGREYEPASVLIERINAESLGIVNGKKRRRSVRA
jgi:type I restriction enzyme, S subunit